MLRISQKVIQKSWMSHVSYRWQVCIQKWDSSYEAQAAVRPVSASVSEVADGVLKCTSSLRHLKVYKWQGDPETPRTKCNWQLLSVVLSFTKCHSTLHCHSWCFMGHLWDSVLPSLDNHLWFLVMTKTLLVVENPILASSSSSYYSSSCQPELGKLILRLDVPASKQCIH